jgi:hypothetical protein
VKQDSSLCDGGADARFGGPDRAGSKCAGSGTATTTSLRKTAECPNPKLATTINRTGDVAETERFRVTGDTIRIRYFKDSTDANLFFSLFTDSSESAGSTSVIMNPKKGDRIIDPFQGPGDYFLEIDADPDTTTYKLAIDNCGSGNGGGNGGAGTGNGGGSASEQYAPNVEITNIINIPGKNLPDTGGPPLLGILFSAAAGLGLITAVVRRRH